MHSKGLPGEDKASYVDMHSKGWAAYLAYLACLAGHVAGQS